LCIIIFLYPGQNYIYVGLYLEYCVTQLYSLVTQYLNHPSKIIVM